MCICILIFPFCNKFRQRSTQSVTGAGFTRTCSHSLSFSPHRSLRLIHFSPRKNVAWLTVGAIWQLGWAWNKTSGSLHFKLCNCRSEILLQHAAGESERLGRWLNWGYTVYSLKLRREESGEVFKKKSQKPWAFASALNVLNADYYQMESNPTPPDGSQLYNLFRYRVPLLTETFIAFISMQLKDQAWKKQHFRQNLRVWRLKIDQTNAERFPSTPYGVSAEFHRLKSHSKKNCVLGVSNIFLFLFSYDGRYL